MRWTMQTVERRGRRRIRRRDAHARSNPRRPDAARAYPIGKGRPLRDTDARNGNRGFSLAGSSRGSSDWRHIGQFSHRVGSVAAAAVSSRRSSTRARVEVCGWTIVVEPALLRSSTVHSIEVFGHSQRYQNTEGMLDTSPCEREHREGVGFIHVDAIVWVQRVGSSSGTPHCTRGHGGKK